MSSSEDNALTITRHFTQNGKSPFDAVTWERREAVIYNADGSVNFQQRGVEAPAEYSQQAVNIIVSKYFYGKIGTDKRETSVRRMIDRVSGKISQWGEKMGYFRNPADTKAFYDELTYVLVTQRAAFNSPVWFNVGLDLYEPESSAVSFHWDLTKQDVINSPAGYRRPQCSACFIQSVDDSMEGIMDLARNEAILFKYGSGTGTNFSSLRSSKETVSGGGTASGPLSFMKGLDAFAGVIKSGGKTRRAAKMAILNADHPDIEAFIDCKLKEEKKAYALMREGYDGSSGPDSEAYESIFYQNANNSVRATDEFMEAATDPTGDAYWDLKSVVGDHTVERVKASELLRKIAEATWACGDPGMQFDSIINHWHTSSRTARIHASNPCCFVGPTLIDTSEGQIRIDMLEQLSNARASLPLAFSWDFDRSLPTLKPIKRVWKAGETTEMVSVTTQRGHVFLCTPEHRFYLYNGEAVAARDLKFDDRLRKINRTINRERSGRKSILHRITTDQPNGCEYQARWMWEQAYGPVPEGKEVHHINEDATDDRLSNFELIDVTDHRIIHSSGDANPRYLSAQEQQLVEVWEAVTLQPKRTHKIGLAVTPARWNKYIAENGLAGTIPLARGDGRIRGMAWNEFRDWVEAQMMLVNDRIQSVEVVQLDEPVPVYDMEVEGTHNFAVTSDGLVHSIVVHNSEYMFLDDSACNLASLNLMKFVNEEGRFLVEDFQQAVAVLTIAMDIIVDMSGYPTEKIARNSHDYRPLGLGYANLGALLMYLGLPYDSDRGRSWAAAITALMTGQAYRTSAAMAQALKPLIPASALLKKEFNQPVGDNARIPMSSGACPGFFYNEASFLRVIDQHLQAARKPGLIDNAPSYLKKAAVNAWTDAQIVGIAYGFRNSQVTVLAPTGTIGFMMDCDTTGVEPELALVKHKRLVGGGFLKIVNQGFVHALGMLGYSQTEVESIRRYVEAYGTVDGSPDIKPEHLAIFDTSFKSAKSKRAISYIGHIRMMEVTQPFLSGAISKTVNLPNDATIQDIEHAYIESWQRGLKSVAIYRDGCKQNQVLMTSGPKKQEPTTVKQVIDVPALVNLGAPPKAIRHSLPDERPATTHKFAIAGHEGYITVGFYENGMPGELFITMSKEGSTISGLMDSFALAISMALQHGVPLELLCNKFQHTRFEPSGWSKNPDIGYTKSIMDYLFRWLELRFLKKPKADLDLPVSEHLADLEEVMARGAEELEFSDSPACPQCGSIMVRNGSCHKCQECGTTSGCS